PTKIEGNPQHPASLGATDAITQAQILSLYDPDRSQAVRHGGRISSWNTCHEALGGTFAALRDRGGRGLRILTDRVTSPTLARQIAALLEVCPEAQWHQYDGGWHDHQ